MAHGAQKAELWARWQKHDPGSAQKIDHSAWDGFLKKFVVVSDPSGINRVRYQAVAAEDFKSLQDYLKIDAGSGDFQLQPQRTESLLDQRL